MIDSHGSLECTLCALPRPSPHFSTLSSPAFPHPTLITLAWNQANKRQWAEETEGTEVDFKLGFLAFCIRNYMLTKKYPWTGAGIGSGVQTLRNLKLMMTGRGQSQREMYKS